MSGEKSEAANKTARRLDYLHPEPPSKLNERAIENGRKVDEHGKLKVGILWDINMSVGKHNLLVDFTRMTQTDKKETNLKIVILGYDEDGEDYCCANFIYAYKKNWMHDPISASSTLLIHTERIDFSREVEMPTESGVAPTLHSLAGKELFPGKNAHFCQALVVKKTTHTDFLTFDISVPSLSPEFRVICQDPINVLTQKRFRSTSVSVSKGKYLHQSPIFAYVSIVNRVSSTHAIDEIIKQEIKRQASSVRPEDQDIAEEVNNLSVSVFIRVDLFCVDSDVCGCTCQMCVVRVCCAYVCCASVLCVCCAYVSDFG